MVIRNVLGTFAVAVLMSGCGGSAEYATSAKSASGYGGYTTASAMPDSVSVERSPNAPPSVTSDGRGGGAEPEMMSQAPTERPGLGTGFGETRESHVHEVSFDREASQPFAVGTLHYNDRHGVEALASFHQAMSGGWLHDVPEAGGAITVSIVGENGAPLDALKVGDRTYVIGHDGERYSIVMTNHTNHRFESVTSVDGLDVVNGQPAGLGNRGYILNAFGRLEIDGFRRSQEAVAAFRFSRVADSYAAQTSGDRNVGVVGVAFFSERGDSFSPWTFDELRTRDTASPFPVDLRYAQPPR